MSRLLYLDHHATTPVDPDVLAKMTPWFSDEFANAASTSHAAGMRAAEAVADARCSLAACLGCEAEEIVLTSGATESNNLAIKGVLHAAGKGGHLIVTSAEHRAVLDPARRLQRQGYSVSVLPVDRFGQIDPDRVVAAITPATRLVSVMLVNNEIGTINNLPAIAEGCHRCGVLVHTDAAQAFGRIGFDVRALDVDLLSITAHKIYGPKGIGALFVRRTSGRIAIDPLLDGGGHERGLRSGTLPVPLVIGFAAAARLALHRLPSEARRLERLRARLLHRLTRGIAGLTVNGHPACRAPGNLNVTLPNIDGDALMMKLRGTELAVSSGAACSSANPEPSHVLRAIGLSDADARASLRFGLGRTNDEDDVDRAAQIVVEAADALREP